MRAPKQTSGLLPAEASHRCVHDLVEGNSRVGVQVVEGVDPQKAKAVMLFVLHFLLYSTFASPGVHRGVHLSEAASDFALSPGHLSIANASSCDNGCACRATGRGGGL